MLASEDIQPFSGTLKKQIDVLKRRRQFEQKQIQCCGS